METTAYLPTCMEI